MNKIKGVFNCNNHIHENFMEDVISNINILQEYGQEVEIIYNTVVENGIIYYSAMIIGRVKNES